MIEVRVAVTPAPGAPPEMRRLAIRAPVGQEVLVRIAGVGICHSDLNFMGGAAPYPFPAVFGHEGAGRVVAVGEAVTRVRVGDAVVMSFRACGACRPCERHLPGYCRDFGALNLSGSRPGAAPSFAAPDEGVAGGFFGQSSFADLALASEDNLVVVEAGDAELAMLGPLGCGVQTGAGTVMRALACSAGSSLLVLGAGGVGLSAVMGAAVQQCGIVVVVEPVAARRALALELGATHAIDPAAGDMGAAIAAILPDGADHVVDTTGITALLDVGLAALAPRGTLALVAMSARGAPLPGDPSGLIGRGASIRGVVEGDCDPQDFIPVLLALHREGRLPFDRFTTVYPLAEIGRAIEDQRAGRIIKAVLRP
ncbi:MAG: NAD(P)-dependent alcohol dehydrogenase [Sphingobium sp.]